jgi:hypothetical protein
LCFFLTFLTKVTFCGNFWFLSWAGLAPPPPPPSANEFVGLFFEGKIYLDFTRTR